MRKRDKWLDQIDAEGAVSDAAQIALKSRLGSVIDSLPLAAEHADETPEHVHQLRVYTRRSLAALAMYRELLPEKRVKWFRKKLRRIRKAAGDARDLDVFSERYRNQKHTQAYKRLRANIKKRRRKAQRPIVELHERLRAGDSFQRHIDRLLDSITCSETICGLRFGQWAREKMGEMTRLFFASAPEPPYNLEDLHRFRIRGKELRYAMELLASAFPAEFRSSLYPLVTDLQERLGQINDHATAIERLGDWVDPSDKKLLRKLIALEQEQMDHSIEEFENWWTPQRKGEMSESFRSLAL